MLEDPVFAQLVENINEEDEWKDIAPYILAHDPCPLWIAYQAGLRANRELRPKRENYLAFYSVGCSGGQTTGAIPLV